MSFLACASCFDATKLPVGIEADGDAVAVGALDDVVPNDHLLGPLGIDACSHADSASYHNPPGTMVTPHTGLLLDMKL